eukprot:5376379-Pyramimonas_sp.AAC.1
MSEVVSSQRTVTPVGYGLASGNQESTTCPGDIGTGALMHDVVKTPGSPATGTGMSHEASAPESSSRCWEKHASHRP